MRTIIIVGCQGQDGRFMYEKLEKNYHLIGIGKDYIISNKKKWNKKIDINKLNPAVSEYRLVTNESQTKIEKRL